MSTVAFEWYEFMKSYQIMRTGSMKTGWYPLRNVLNNSWVLYVVLHILFSYEKYITFPKLDKAQYSALLN